MTRCKRSAQGEEDAVGEVVLDVDDGVGTVLGGGFVRLSRLGRGRATRT